MPDNNIEKQCLQLSRDTAGKSQPGILQKIKDLCHKYNSSSTTLNKNNSKMLTSQINHEYKQSLVVNHQPLLLNSNKELGFHNAFKTDNKKAVF